jgi:hypothetical protein
MLRFLRLCLGAILRLFRSRQNLLVENLALRQQLNVFKRRNRRPKLVALDKLFWVMARRFWSDWKKSLLVVAPETVVRWHRSGFRLYWSMISKIRKRVGRKEDFPQRAQSDFPDGGRELHLGRSPQPRRTTHAGLGRIRAKCLALDEASTQGSGTGPGAGWLFFAIIVKRSRPWIFLPSRQSPSSCCTASLLLGTTDDRLFTSTSLAPHQ